MLSGMMTVSFLSPKRYISEACVFSIKASAACWPSSFSSYYGLDDCVIKAFYQNAPKLGPNPNPQPEPQPPKPEPPQPPTPLLQVLEEIDLIIYYTL